MNYSYTLGKFVKKNLHAPPPNPGRNGAGHAAEVRMREPRGRWKPGEEVILYSRDSQLTTQLKP